MSDRRVRFAVIGLDHAHIFGIIRGQLEAGSELVGLASDDPQASVCQTVRRMFPDVAWFDDAAQLIDDPSIDLIATAAIPYRRGEIAIQALQAGKHVLTDKPGCVSFEQLDAIRQTVASSGRFWVNVFSERFEVPAVARAGELARSGAIGTVVQTLGLGPHREGDKAHLSGGAGRPEWFYRPQTYGGIIVDIASHQIDQFLWFTGSRSGEVVASTVGNFRHPEVPAFEDFGELMLRSDHGQGYIRVDWYTPDGLPTWGDGRLFVLGTEGYIEIRKYVDIAGREGTNHLFLVNQDGVQHLPCEHDPNPFHSQIVADVLHNTRTAVPQEHTFEVLRLGLQAQAQAARRGNLPA